VILRARLVANSRSRCGRAGDSPGPVTDSDANPSTTEAPASLAEAEEELSRAEARAEAAHARAAELRRQAEAGSSDKTDTTAVEETADETAQSAARSRRWLRWRVRRPARKAVGAGAAIVLIAASLGAAVYMAWQHFTLVHENKRAAEFAAAAGQGVELMMSIDPDHAQENIQRLIDNTTGALQSQLRVTSTYLVKDAQDAKVTTKATVQDVAVESMTDNSAVVLVVSKSDTTNPDKSKRAPVFWRLSVNIDRDGSQLKMSKVDFVQ
jgi:Mce-associated membrane protein